MRAIFRRKACWVLLGATLAACSSEARHDSLLQSELDDPGTLRGHLLVQIADFDDGTTETRYFLRDVEGVNHRLVARGNIDVAPGSSVRIRGVRRPDDAIDLVSYESVREAAEHSSASQPLIDSGPKSSRVLCAGVVALNGVMPKTTTAAASQAFHTAASSVNSFHLENSYGKVGIGGGVYGPFSYNVTDGCDYMGLATAVRPMIDASAGAKCDQYAFIFANASCGWSALGQYGTRDAPATDSWFNDSLACVVAVQEPNHNYGLLHSSSLTCPNGPFADDLTACVHSEYGDKYDAMGSGCYHMNGWQKLHQRWFGGCNAVSTSSSGTFYLQAIEQPCDGVQVLRVPFPGGKTRTFQDTTLTSYYLELRAPIGFDSKITAPQVFIRAGGDPPVAKQINAPGLRTWHVNLNSGGVYPGLLAGQVFNDPTGGLAIRVQSIEQTRATVSIEYFASTESPYCLDDVGSRFLPPGPEWCGSDGGTGGRGGVAGADGGGFGGVGGTCPMTTGAWLGPIGCSGTGGFGVGGSSTGGRGGTGGTTGGAGGTGTGGTIGGSGGVGTGSGGSVGGSGGSGGEGGHGGIGTGGDAGRAGDPTGGSGGSRVTSGTGGMAGAGASATGSTSGADRDASIGGAAGTDDDITLRRQGSCVCTLHARGDSSRAGAALAALCAVAVGRRRRRRSS
jgi:hypothetical protein